MQWESRQLDFKKDRAMQPVIQRNPFGLVTSCYHDQAQDGNLFNVHSAQVVTLVGVVVDA